MTSSSLQQITVPFHNAELFLVEHNGQPYTPLRQIVQGMGLDWASQFTKIKQKFASCVVEITMQILGDDQARSHTCIPVRKLPAWLYSVNPNKVKPELRETVIMYQEECDDVLWDYWTKGIAVNPRSTKEEREPLTNAVNLLVAKTKHLNYSDAYKLVHQRFNVKHIDEIPYDEIPVAVEYVHHLIALYGRTQKQESLFDNDAYESVRKLTESIILENDEIVPILLAVKMIDEKRFAYLAHKVVRTNENARIVSQQLDFRSKIGEPLIDRSCQVISLSTGQRFAARPNWFNAPA